MEQAEVIWDHGAHIGERIEGEHKIILYQIFSFYVELYYHMEYNVLRRLRSFSSTECLEAYIMKVDLSEIKFHEYHFFDKVGNGKMKLLECYN